MKNPDKEKHPGGRPPKDTDSPRDGHIHLRCDLARKGRYVAAARRRQQSLADWIITTCDHAESAAE